MAKKTLLIVSVFANILFVAVLFLANRNIKDLQEDIKNSEMYQAWHDHRIISIFLEVVKKQNYNKDELISLFTFYDKCLLEKRELNDMYWQSLDYNKRDMDYDKSFDDVYWFSASGISFLFKNGYLVDYRYRSANRKQLKNYLKNIGRDSIFIDMIY